MPPSRLPTCPPASPALPVRSRELPPPRPVPPGRPARSLPSVALRSLLTAGLGLALLSPAAADGPSPDRIGYDTLPSNGGVLYALSHSGVTDGSLSVRANGRPLQSGQDFLFNADSGMLTLVQPLEPGTTLRIRYRYQPDKDKSGSAFRFSFAPGFASDLNLGALYATAPGGLNLSGSTEVSGLVMDPKSLGMGKLSGMMLFSRTGGGLLNSLQQSRDSRSALLPQLVGGPKAASASDSLYQYSLSDMKVGRGTFGLGYRKVGQAFDFTPVASAFNTGPQKALFDQLQKERGLSTLGFNGQYGFAKGLTSQMKLTQVSDGAGTAMQTALGLTGKAFDLSYKSLKAAPGFTHLKQADLQDVGDLKPGQEHSELVANLRPTHAVSFQTALTRARNEKGDLQTVRKLIANLKAGKNSTFSLAQEQAIARLANGAASTKSDMRQTLTFNHQTKGLVLQACDDILHSTQDGTKSIARSQLFHLETDPKKATQFMFDRQLETHASGLKKDSHKIKFATSITKLATIQWSDDFLRVQQPDQLKTAYDRKLRIETDAKRPISLLVDRSDTKQQDSADKLIQQIALTAQVSPQLSLKDTQFDQADGTKGQSGNKVEFTAKPDSKVAVTGTFLTGDDTERGAITETDVDLKTKAGNIEIGAEHHEATADKANQGMTETGLSLAAPVGDGTKVTGSYLDHRDKGGAAKLFHALGLQRALNGGQLLMELGQTRYLEGHPFATYALGYTSNKDDKLPLRFTTLFRNMNASDGSQVSEYQYGVDYRLNPRFSLSAKTYQNNSVRDGYFYKITPVRGHAFSIDGTLTPKLKLSAGFSNEQALDTRKFIRNQNLSLKGSLDKATTIDLSYISFIVDKWKEETPTHWLKLSINRDLSDEDRLVLTCDARFWKDTDPSTPDKSLGNAQLEFVRAF